MNTNDSFIKMLKDYESGTIQIDTKYEEVPDNFGALDGIRAFLPIVNNQLFLFVTTGFFNPDRTVENCNKSIKDATIYLHNFVKSVSYSIDVTITTAFALDFLTKCRNLHNKIFEFITELLDYDDNMEKFITEIYDSCDAIIDNSLKLLDLKLKVLIKGVEFNDPILNVDRYPALLETTNAVRLSEIFNKDAKSEETKYLLPEIQSVVIEGTEETKINYDESDEEAEPSQTIVDDELDIAELNQQILQEIQDLPDTLLSTSNGSPEVIEAIAKCFADQPTN